MHEAGSGEGELWRGRINEQESKLQLIRANFLERNLKESMIGQAENALGTNVSTQQKPQSLALVKLSIEFCRERAAVIGAEEYLTEADGARSLVAFVAGQVLEP